MSRVLLACGGTGGHLAPGIALAQRLTEDGHECLLIVSSKIVDARTTCPPACVSLASPRSVSMILDILSAPRSVRRRAMRPGACSAYRRRVAWCSSPAGAKAPTRSIAG